MMSNPKLAVDAKSDVPIIILAAGRSSRFGGLKQLARLQGKTLLETVLNVADKVSNHLVLVTGAYASKIKAELQQDLEKKAVQVAYNPDWMVGMSTSINVGINSLDVSAPAALIILADQPFITADHLRLLIDSWQDGHQNIDNQEPVYAVASYYQSAYAVPALFDKVAFQDLSKLQGDQGAKALLNLPQNRVLSVHPDFPTIDIDEPEQLQSF